MEGSIKQNAKKKSQNRVAKQLATAVQVLITGKKKRSEAIFTPSTRFNEVWYNFFNLMLRILQKELKTEQQNEAQH